MAPIIFTETDNATICGPMIACAAATLNNDRTVDAEAVSGGTAGTTEQSVRQAAGSTDQASLFFQMAPPTDTDWDSGDWTVRFEVTTGNTNITWQEVYVCRIDGSCNSVETLASATGIGVSMSAGIHSQIVNQGAAVTPNANDEVFVVIVFDFAGNHGNEQMGITPSQDIDSPIEPAASAAGRVIATDATGVIQTDANGVIITE